MIIGISGKINSGKDTVGKIIQYLYHTKQFFENEDYVKDYKELFKLEPYTEASFIDFCIATEPSMGGDWEIKKFADKLKDMVCLLINCTREQLEDRNFKEKELGEEWWKYDVRWYSAKHSNGIFNTYEEAKQRALNIGASDKDINTLDIIQTIKLTPRKLLQLLGTECGRNIIHPNIWVNALMSEYKWDGITMSEGWIPTYSDPDNSIGLTPAEPMLPNWIITDLRFPNELKAVKDRGGISIRVNRDTDTIIGRSLNNINTHLSETALDNAEFDYTIENNGTIDDLIMEVKRILETENII